MESLILGPEQYTQVPIYDLLRAMEQGFVGIDHRALHAIVDDPEKSVPDLVRFGLEEREDARQNLDEDLIQIFRHLRTPAAIPYLVKYLRQNHLDATIPVICAFQEIGEPAVEPLLKLYAEVAADEDSDAAFLLGSLGVRDPRILQVLVDRLKTDPIDAGHCLAAYRDPAAIPAIRQAIEEAEEPWIAQSLRAGIEEIEAGPRELEEEPFDLWELYPADTDPPFDLLTEEETERFLDSANAENRFAAVSVVSDEIVPERLWDRLLEMARNDPDARVRGECWQALMDGWERPDIRAAMHACVADESLAPDERGGALLALSGREGDKPEIQKWMLQFYEQPETRSRALQAMAVAGEPRFGKYFSKHLDDPDQNVCGQAMLGVGLLELTSEAPRLIPYFGDEHLREDALACYALCAPADLSRAGLMRLFKKIDKLAGGLSEDDEVAVKGALNTRAERYDMEPVFGQDGDALVADPVVAASKVGRNDPCPCGSGKKHKKCCGK